MREVIKIAIVDDSSTYRKYLTIDLKQFDDFEIIIQSSNGQELKDALLSQIPHVALLDAQMPVMDGLQTTEYLSKHYPVVKKIILTAHNDVVDSMELIKKGANGFLPKENGINQIVEAIYTVVLKQQNYFVGKDLEKMILPNTEKSEFIVQLNLSERELQILELVCSGNTSVEIAKKLFISKRTVEVHRTNVFQKTQTNSMVLLAQFALHHGLIKYGDKKK